MGRWPDPILRRTAQEVDARWLGTSALVRASQMLSRTAQREGAVGLAAQQCGVDGRMIYVQGYGVCINPKLVARSPESELKVWQERCLVLPPTWTATVLRDAWIDVEYYTPEGKRKHARLQGEASRCLQHEYDHDRGILVTDHVGLEELESETMRDIERPGHEQRQAIAYSRQLDNPLV
jgi:peptide deformylase